MLRQVKTLLTIAGSDPVGGAGIQADIRVGCSLGLHVVTAVTTLTAQNSKGILDFYSDPDFLRLQLEAIREDVIPDAVKIGLIGVPSNIKIICRYLDSLPASVPIVVDPILYLSAASLSLLKIEFDSLELRKLYLSELFPRASVLTPNLDELKILTGIDSPNNLALKALNTEAMVVKGGHSKDDKIRDVLVTPGKVEMFTHERINCHNTHGSGCVFSSFLASYLGLGETLEKAFLKTCRTMEKIISKSCHYNLGNSTYGPLNINENYICHDDSI